MTGRASLARAADRPLWSWLAIPLLILAACSFTLDIPAPLPVWILAAPVWACAAAADARSTWSICKSGACRETNPVLAWTMGRLGMKRALLLHFCMYAAILAALPLGLEYAGETLRVGHDAGSIAGMLLLSLAGAHVWCAGGNVRLRRGPA